MTEFDSEPISWEQMKAMRPSDDQNRARAQDLLRRARLVQAHGWDAYQHVWSSGEVAGVAHLLDAYGVLAEENESTESVLNRYAGDLFGITGGDADIAAGHPATRAWFAQLRAEFDGGR